MSDLTTTFQIGDEDIEVLVTYEFLPGEPRSFSSPGIDDQIEIIEVRSQSSGKPITLLPSEDTDLRAAIWKHLDQQESDDAT